jgi:hypothetical protein
MNIEEQPQLHDLLLRAFGQAARLEHGWVGTITSSWRYSIPMMNRRRARLCDAPL